LEYAVRPLEPDRAVESMDEAEAEAEEGIRVLRGV
jgi:hypothetical protein